MGGSNILNAEVERNDDGVIGGSVADLPFANDLTGSFLRPAPTCFRLWSLERSVPGVTWIGTFPASSLRRAISSRRICKGRELGRGHSAIRSCVCSTVTDRSSPPTTTSSVWIRGSSLTPLLLRVTTSLWLIRSSGNIGSYRLTAQLQTTNPLNFGDVGEVFLIEVTEPTTLEITTTTPGDAVGEPGNDLNPAIELRAPDGTSLGAADNGAADGRTRA